LQEVHRNAHSVETVSEMEFFSIPQIGRRSLIAQGVAGLIALFVFMINSAFEQFLPDLAYWSTFGYVLFSLSTMITLGIQQNNKTTEVGKKCHYCDGPIEVNSYKCKSCKKEQ
jgi:hypothetical protein